MNRNVLIQVAALVAIRDSLQGLLDNYQVMDTAAVTHKSAIVQLDDLIQTPDAPIVTVQQPVVGTADVIAGVLAGLSENFIGLPMALSSAVLNVVTPEFDAINARFAALTPPPAIAPAVLAPTDAQVAAAQAVMAAVAAGAQPAAAAQ